MPVQQTRADGPKIRLRAVTKTFGALVACDAIDLAVVPGRVHAIVGENGAGKSTLMKILAGEIPPDDGGIEVDGTATRFRSPREAQRAGIGIVHQHFLLADALTVWENIVLADEPGSPLRLDIDRARARVRSLAEENGFDLDPDAIVGELGVGARQRVEILKVLYRDAQVIILDEPTAVLVPQEAAALFRAMRAFTAAGAAVIFISHKLDEVLAFADEITVVRRGRVVGQTTPAETTAPELARLMVEVAIPVRGPRTTPIGEGVALAVERLRVDGAGGAPLVDDVSFDVHGAEIVGVAGVEGNGQSELLRALLARQRAGGTVRIAGEDVSALGTRDRRRRGIGYIPEDRHRDGVVLGLPMRDNAVLGYHDAAPVRRAGWFSRRAATEAASRIIADFDVRGATPLTPASALSGGNQQKFIVGRELSHHPRVLIAAHPTRGVDIGAQAAVWSEITAARDAGLGVLLVSADLDELLALSDRLLVMYRGRIVAELDAGSLDADDLGEYMTGARSASGEAAA